MKKLAMIMIAFAFMPFVSMGSNDNETSQANNSTEIVKTTINDNEWTPIGTTEISVKVGRSAASTQKVQVYRNSQGTRAIKDKYGYQEIRDNSMYNRFPADECFECGYRYTVLYNHQTWYTNGIVKQTYGSY